MKQGTEFTAELARAGDISPQGINEGDSAFRDRVSGELRARGCIIEAHEALHNQRFDEHGGETGPMAGIMGAVAVLFSGKNYGSSGSTRVGDEIAADVVARKPLVGDSEAGLMAALAIMSSEMRGRW